MVCYLVIGVVVMILFFFVFLFVDGLVCWCFFNVLECLVIFVSIVMMLGVECDDIKDMIGELEWVLVVVGVCYEIEYGENLVLFVFLIVGGIVGCGLSGVDIKDVD